MKTKRNTHSLARKLLPTSRKRFFAKPSDDLADQPSEVLGKKTGTESKMWRKDLRDYLRAIGGEGADQL